MALLNYSTIIDADQTISEIQRMLSKHGVSAMMTEYDGLNVSAVSFKMLVKGQSMGFRLPCNWHAVHEIFRRDGIPYIKHKDKNIENQAIRTAWRVIRDWTESQLALVDINMVTVPQVFLPYTIMRDGRTLSEHVDTNPGFLLGDGK